jgi:hypothetical protein
MTRDIINYDVPEVQALIVGIDIHGPHIYVVDNGEVSCNDIIGFAAIGIGARHAQSQFMLAKHSWSASEADTALLTYVAKKRSEVAPGVGQGTDMFLAGPQLGTFSPMGQDVVQHLDRIYQRMKRREDRNQRDAQKEVNHYVDDRKAQREATQQKDKVQQKPDDEAEITFSGVDQGNAAKKAAE